MAQYNYIVLQLVVLIATVSYCHSDAFSKNPKFTDPETHGNVITTCGGIIEGVHGIIDYMFPEGESYPPNKHCIWTIRTWPSRTYFKFYKEESDLDLGNDFLVVQTYQHSKGLHQQFFIGKDTNDEEEYNEEDHNSLGSQVAFISFATGPSASGRGFRLHWQAYGNAEVRVKNRFDVNDGSYPGSLSYPTSGNYPSYAISTVVMTKNHTGAPYLTMSFDYDLEQSVICKYDVLDAYSIYPDERGIVHEEYYCGTQNATVTFSQTEDAGYLLILKSDDLNEGRGFNVTWS